MSALAIIALSQGYRVSGSDARASAQLDAVREAGATCFVGHDARHVGGSDARETSTLDDPSREPIVDPPDAVVVSSAVPGDNVEVAFARETGIPVFSRAQWLARVTRGRSVAAVAGTHGKTSTSAALAVALRSAGLDVSAIVGGNVPQFPNGRNAVGGGDDVFVVEADEYDGAFLGLEPTTAVLLNVEHDHPDMFEDERAVIEMFARFLKRVKPGGTVVACGDDANVRSLVNGLPEKVWDERDETSDDELLDDDSGARRRVIRCVTFGFGANNAWRAVDVRFDKETGGCSFNIEHEGAFVSEVSVPGIGAYAALNALAAFVAAAVVCRGRFERRHRLFLPNAVCFLGDARGRYTAHAVRGRDDRRLRVRRLRAPPDGGAFVHRGDEGVAQRRFLGGGVPAAHVFAHGNDVRRVRGRAFGITRGFHRRDLGVRRAAERERKHTEGKR
jgi:UDP-N-acetylmuramate-alanine ligase